LKKVRPTHPKSPLYFPPKVEADQESADQLSVDFSQLTGSASDAQVPQSAVTQHQAALALSFTQMTDNPTSAQKAAVLASAALTGTPTAPTPAPGDNDTSVATTAFVTAAVAAVGSPARGDVSVTTASLADGATQTGVITLGKSSLILKFTGSCACRIRLYSTAAYRTADAARPPGTDPTGEHGVMLDIVLPAGNLTWDLSPLAAVTNDDGPPISDIYYAIQNKSGAAAAVTATLTRITLES
jgi:hypothetical protein